MNAWGRFALVSACLLAGCGGGGGGSDDSPAASTPAPAYCPGVSVVADSTVQVGQAGGASIASCTTLSSVQWTQTSGGTVTLQSAQDQTISFEPTSTGSYGFHVSWRDSTGATGANDVTIAATDTPSTSRITARVDQSVRSGAAVSLRYWASLVAADAVADVTWTQTQGPSVVLAPSASGASALLQFTAPLVSRDVLLRFKVTLTTTAGTTASDDVSVLVEGDPGPPGDGLWKGAAVLERVHPYRSTSPVASLLANCIYNSQSRYTSALDNNLCTANQLPLLGSAGDPTIEQILDRVLVSHDWMGANFEQFLRTQDPDGDFRRLLGGVTSVVIGAHVRPSFYYPVTGAIHLDPDDLWLTAAQRDTINEAPDYRSNFDADLQYTRLFRYVRGDQYAIIGYATTVRAERTLPALVPLLGDVLYHELAHASDFFPVGARALDGSKTIIDNLNPRLAAQLLTSDALASQYGLQSSVLFGLAQVKYAGVQATTLQASYQPNQIGAMFGADRATDDYAYLKSGNNAPREDTALLFEEFMMVVRRGIRRDVAFTNKVGPTTTASQAFVAWGQRGRVADPAVKPRVRLVVSRIAPWIDVGLVDSLPTPTDMIVGNSWAANLALGDGVTAQRVDPWSGATSPSVGNRLAIGDAGRVDDSAHRPMSIDRLR